MKKSNKMNKDMKIKLDVMLQLPLYMLIIHINYTLVGINMQGEISIDVACTNFLI
jgi:hypothetical protein